MANEKVNEVIGLIAYAIAQQEPTIKFTKNDNNTLTLTNGPDQFLLTIVKVPESVQ